MYWVKGKNRMFDIFIYQIYNSNNLLQFCYIIQIHFWDDIYWNWRIVGCGHASESDGQPI